MKTNAPDKIYVQPNAHDGWFESNPHSNIFVEYTRTDAFIDKAAEWLNNFYNEDTHSCLIDEDIEKFINYMK